MRPPTQCYVWRKWDALYKNVSGCAIEGRNHGVTREDLLVAFSSVSHGRVDVVNWQHETNGFVSFVSKKEAENAMELLQTEIEDRGWIIQCCTVQKFCVEVSRCHY